MTLTYPWRFMHSGYSQADAKVKADEAAAVKKAEEEEAKRQREVKDRAPCVSVTHNLIRYP